MNLQKGIFTFLIFLCLLGCSSSNDHNQIYEDTENGYSIKFPDTWVIKPNFFSMLMATNYSAEKSSGTLKNKSAISISVKPLSDLLYHDSIYDYTFRRLEKIPNVSLQEEGTILINHDSASFKVYKTFLGNEIYFHEVYILLLKNQKLFSVKCTTPSQNYMSARDTFFQIAKSLNFN